MEEGLLLCLRRLVFSKPVPSRFAVKSNEGLRFRVYVLENTARGYKFCET